MNKLIIFAVIAGIILMFLMPLWVMWTVKELFNIDWSGKYWAVFSLIMIVSATFNFKRGK